MTCPILTWPVLTCHVLTWPGLSPDTLETPSRYLPDTFRIPFRHQIDILQTLIKYSRSIRHSGHFLLVEVWWGYCCQTPVLGLGLGVDFTFAWDHKKKKNPHLNFLERVRLQPQLANQSSQVKLQLEARMSTTGVEKSNITPLNSTHLNIQITPLNRTVPYNWAADRRPYLNYYWSEVSQIFKVGWLGSLHKLASVLGTFLPLTFVQLSHISTVTGQNSA